MGTEHESDLGDETEVIDLRALDRRAALKKGAVVASAALWATPVVQTVGISRAAAQDPSVPTSTTTTSTTTGPTSSTTTTSTTTTTAPSSTTTTTSPPATEICNIQIIVRHNSCLYGLLYDGHHWIQWSDRAPDAIDCIRFYGQANRVEASWLIAVLFTIRVRVTKVSPFLWRVALPLPPGVEFVAGWAQAGDASVTGCRSAAVTSSAINFSTS